MTNEELEKIVIKDYQMVSHLSMTKVHRSKYSGIFECEGLPIHGKKCYQEIEVRVKKFGGFGKTTSIFYLDSPASPIFDSIKDLVNYYCDENSN